MSGVVIQSVNECQPLQKLWVNECPLNKCPGFMNNNANVSIKLYLHRITQQPITKFKLHNTNRYLLHKSVNKQIKKNLCIKNQ